MADPIVLFLDTVHPKVWESLKAAGCKCIDHSGTSKEELRTELSNATGLIVRHRLQLDEEFIGHGKSLKWIARSGVGLDNIDLDYCKENGIQVVNAAGGNAVAVGEHVVGMMIDMLRHQHRADKEVRKGLWRREANRGLELGSMTLGIVGYGNTGRALAKCLSGFGARVLAYDKYASVDGPYASTATLEDIHTEADIISFHVPLNEETHHYFDSTFLAQMHKPFYLINAARGSVADQRAVAEGLRSGKIVAAGLDVLENEPKDEGLLHSSDDDLNYLLESENVIFSPHIAGWTVESYEGLADILIKRILDLT